MTEIVNGILKYNETTKNANGGTELMARRMVRDIPQPLLEGFQIIHSRVREIDPNLRKILVCHDLATDPEVANLSDPQYRKQFDKIVFVSHHQQHTYNMVHGIPFHESYVIRNGVESRPFKERVNDGKIRLIYHTTPHRGLVLLNHVFKYLQEEFKNLHLDVFSSFEIYGWKERNEQYKELFEDLESNPDVTMHGFQPNDVVRDYLDRSHIFAYPSIWPETSCIAMIEAMCSGNLVVHSNLGALNETSLGLTQTYMYNENPQKHIDEFYTALRNTIVFVNDNLDSERLRGTQSYIAQRATTHYNWDTVKFEWFKLLTRLKD